MEFVESFMKFSFQDDDIFRIEEDELVQSTDGIKACECVVLISENVALIEAKSSAPKIDNEEKFQQFISDIRQKFADSLQLYNDIIQLYILQVIIVLIFLCIVFLSLQHF